MHKYLFINLSPAVYFNKSIIGKILGILFIAECVFNWNTCFLEKFKNRISLTDRTSKTLKKYHVIKRNKEKNLSDRSRRQNWIETR